MEEISVSPSLPGSEMQGSTALPSTPAPINSKLQLIILVVACVLFGLSLLFGIYSGFSLGRSEVTFQNAQQINIALQYYKADQVAYPTADQFYTQRILVPFYLPALPEPSDASGSCKNFTQFIYTQPAPGQFLLEFCLTSGTNGLGSGLHAFTEKGLE